MFDYLRDSISPVVECPILDEILTVDIDKDNPDSIGFTTFDGVRYSDLETCIKSRQ